MASDDFPYKRIGQPTMEQDIARRFRALMSYRPQFISARYVINNARELSPAQLRFAYAGSRGPMVMVLHARDYDQYNLITDFFIEEFRIRAYRGDDPARESVYDYWLKHREEIRARCGANRDAQSAAHCARELVFARKMEVGTFRPTVAASLVHLLRERFATPCDWVLNPCAGWGDRLMGFMAAKVRGLIDIDPNVELGANYEKMYAFARAQIESTSGDSHPIAHKYYPLPFEDIPDSELLRALAEMRAREFASANSPRDGFDLAFIAPPYFDLEVYVPNDRAGTQSISRYPTFERWYSQFLIASLKKCARLLRTGGILALLINQAPAARTDPRARFLERMIRDMSASRLRYLGVISYAEMNERNALRSPQPLWFWMRESD